MTVAKIEMPTKALLSVKKILTSPAAHECFSDKHTKPYYSQRGAMMATRTAACAHLTWW